MMAGGNYRLGDSYNVVLMISDGIYRLGDSSNVV